MSAPERLTERQRELIAQATETVGLTAAAIAAGMRDIDLNSREDVYRAAYSRTKVRLAMALAVIDELTAAPDAGTVTLTAEQLATVLGALADAQTHRMGEADAFCADCETSPAGACWQHLNDLDAAQAYHDLAGILGGGR